jgi:hypothetical protein
MDTLLFASSRFYIFDFLREAMRRLGGEKRGKQSGGSLQLPL